MFKGYVLGAVLALALPFAANAATYEFSFTGAGGAPVGSGIIHTSDTLDAAGGFDITSVSGSFGADAITGLIPNPNQPGETSLPTNTYDNVLFPGGTPTFGRDFDRFGIAFNVGADIYNIFDGIADGGTSDTTEPYGLIINGQESFGTFSLTAIPEPASWALMLFGVLGIGAALRGRRQLQPVVG